MPTHAEQALHAVVAQSLPWQSIGPARGGRVTAVAGVVQEPHRFYAGTVGGGVLRTQNAGHSWESIATEVFGSASVGAVAVAPSKPEVVYAGMGEATQRMYASSLGDGVYKSTDGGNSWKHLGLTNTRRVGSIVIHPTDPDRVYVAALGNPWAASEDRGVYRTNDGGASWERVLFVSPTTSALELSMDPSDSNTLYASTWDNIRTPWYLGSGGPGSGIYKSTDGGATWRRLAQGLPAEIGKISVAVSPADRNRIYALLESIRDLGGLYVSDDAGEHWRLINNSEALWNRAWYYIHITPDPKVRDRVWVPATRLWRSDDGGRSFVSVDTPHGDNHALWINPRDTRIMVEGNDGGATVSLDTGASWSSLFNQRTGQFYRVAVDRRLPYSVLSAQQDWGTVSVLSRTDLGIVLPEVAFEVGGGEAGFVVADPFERDLIYAGSELGVLTRFDRRSGTSTPITPYARFPEGIAPHLLKYRFQVNAPVVASAHVPGTIYHAAQKVLRSRDRGNTWEEVSPDLTRNEIDKQRAGGGPFTNERIDAHNVIATLDESPLDARVLWAGTDDGRVQVTRNAGAQWHDVTPPKVRDGEFCTITASPSVLGGANAALSRHRLGDMRPHLYRTRDFGKTWTRVSDTLPQDTFARTLIEDPDNSEILYAGTERGVQVSLDGGARWWKLGSGMPPTPITGIVVVEDDVVVSTDGSGLWILRGRGTLAASRALQATATHLFRPPTAYITEGSPGGWTAPAERTNRQGVRIDFLLGTQVRTGSDDLRLEILDSRGALLRTIRPPKEADPGLSESPGPRLQHAWWDFRREAVAPTIEGALDGSMPGGRVPAGEYRVRLRLGSSEQTQPLKVRWSSRQNEPAPEAVQQKDALLRRIETVFADVTFTVNEMAAQRAAAEGSNSMRAKALSQWEARIFDRRLKDGQARVNFGGGLLFDLLVLARFVDGAETPITAAMSQRCAELEDEWRAIKSALP